MAGNIIVLLIDEQVVVSRGLQLVISKNPNMDVVGEAHNASEALLLAKQHRVDVIVFDIAMKDGIELLLALKKDYHCIPVLVLSHHCENEICLRYIRIGAAGCLCKTRSAEDLVTAIQKIHTTGKFISDLVALHLVDQLGGETVISPHLNLSEREFQVFKKLSSGTESKEVASDLFLSPKTVSTYKKRVLEKLKCKNISELTRYALAECLV